MNRLLFLDTETGGLDPQKYTLLSIGIAIWDKESGIIYKREIAQQCEKYDICKEAIDINHFDINKFDLSNILTPLQIIQWFNDIKSKFFLDNKIPVAGHNIYFDIAFLRKLYQSIQLNYEDYFSFRAVDTFSLLQYLIHKGRIPDKINNSTTAFEHFGIKVNDRHTALGDAIATAELYQKLLSL